MAARLSEKQRANLRREHRRTRERRQADRIKSLLLLDDGWTYEEVAEVLLLDDETIRRWEKCYLECGLEQLQQDNYQGSEGKLTTKQEEEVKNHLVRHLYQSTKEIIVYVAETFGVSFSISGMAKLLHRINFVYKKARSIPCKADEQKQQEFLKQYHELKDAKKGDEIVLFGDGCHPQHNSLCSYGWIPKGEEHHIPSNTGRKRINLNGAINPETLEVTVRCDETLNSDSTIVFFKDIETKYPSASVIYLILDNARYYRSQKVREYLEGSRLKIIFLPPSRGSEINDK